MAGANLLVFRDVDQQLSGRVFVRRLVETVEKIRQNSRSSLLDALLLAGELECALEDCDSPCSRDAVAISDALAAAFIGTESFGSDAILAALQRLDNAVPEIVNSSMPEGFAYYALHPADFADAVTAGFEPRPAAVIGIRSIGTVLSAIAVAAIREPGNKASRITVRPNGHPYDRKLHFSGSHLDWVNAEQSRGSQFFILDEGPGLSGSSFLCVAEALVERGVSPDRVTLFGSREIDPTQLCAPDAARRWQRFRWRKVSSRICRRFGHDRQLGGGAWRELYLESKHDWPACWPEMETLKFLSPDHHRIFKFEGFGERGHDLRDRARLIQKAGFGPVSVDAGDGMSEYTLIAGKPLTASDLSAAQLDRMAQYCAFRAIEFATPRVTNSQLQPMAQFNFQQETGRNLEIPDGLLESTHPVLADARMHPHKWIHSEGGIHKVDGCAHGDDHFLPGPTDIKWDLAGAIVEWNMDTGTEEYFLARFRERSGIETATLPYFLLAYSIFRTAFCRMALLGTQVETEKPRLQSAYEHYRKKLSLTSERLLAATG